MDSECVLFFLHLIFNRQHILKKMKNHKKNNIKVHKKKVIREERAVKEIEEVNGTNNRRSLYYKVEYEETCRTMNSFISNNSS